MREYSNDQAQALAIVTMMPRMVEATKSCKYARDIMEDLAVAGSFEMKENATWTGRVRNVKGGKKRVKEILEACGVVFTGGDRFSGPLVATLNR